jgi:hypothetical protein
MVNQNDILARLQAGESADVIAQELVNALNAANAQFAEEQAAAQKANDIAAQKAEFVEEMAEIVRDYIMTFHADSYIAEMIADQEINPIEIVEMLDQSFEQLDQEIRKLKELEKACKKEFGHPPVNIFRLGGVVSANTGPDALAITFLGANRGPAKQN